MKVLDGEPALMTFHLVTCSMAIMFQTIFRQLNSLMHVAK